MTETTIIQNLLDQGMEIDEIWKRYRALFLDLTSFEAFMQKELLGRNMKRSQLLAQANVNRNFGYQILNGTRRPTRDILFKFAFVLGFTPDETNHMLRLCNEAELYPRRLRDAAVIYCMNQHYSLTDAQLYLQDNCFDMLAEADTPNA